MNQTGRHDDGTKLEQEPTPTAVPAAHGVSVLKAGSRATAFGCKGVEHHSETPDGTHVGEQSRSSVPTVRGDGVFNFDAITCPSCRTRPCRCLETRPPRHVISSTRPGLFDGPEPKDAA